MFKNYLKIVFRNLKRHKVYSFINIIGLSIGMTACLLIAFYVVDELTFDRYHENANRIFRIAFEFQNEKGAFIHTTAPALLTPVLKKDFPQIEKAVRFWQNLDMVVSSDRLIKFYNFKNHIYADPEIFDVFTITFLHGNPETALSHPNSVVITEDIANLYFGTDNALGKILDINKTEYAVTGIIRNIPHNTHLPKFKFLTAFKKVEDRAYMKSWDRGLFVPTYLKIKNQIDINSLEAQINHIVYQYAGKLLESQGITYTYFLQRLTDIHLHPNFTPETGMDNVATRLFFFSIIAFLILFIACLNFINLMTARATIRSREIGIRKTLGGNRFQLIVQFLGESFLISLAALLIAFIFVELLLPWYNGLTGEALGIKSLFLPAVIGISIGTVIFVGFISGMYPAFYLSSFQPTLVLKANPLISFSLKRSVGIGKSNITLRKSLVIIQFILTSVFITAILNIYRQIHFMKNHDLGFDKSQIVVLPVQTQQMCHTIRNNMATIKREFTRHHSVVSATAHLSSPGRMTHQNDITMIKDGKPEKYWVNLQFMDCDFLDTYKIPVLAGANFSKISKNKNPQFIINEAAVKKLGFLTPEESLGHQISLWHWKGEIIGVSRNFHFWSLRYQIEPMVFMSSTDLFPEAFSLRLRTQNLPETMAFIKKTHQTLFSGNPFEYYFLDEDFERLYGSDEKFGKILFIFTALAIIIACLGLFGLVMFIAERKRKEIGIRKVLGSSVTGIVLLLVKDFTKWIVIANIVAVPIAWYAINKWLQNFAYRINIAWWTFILVVAVSLVISLLTVSYQAIKAAMVNPVEALKYE